MDGFRQIRGLDFLDIRGLDFLEVGGLLTRCTNCLLKIWLRINIIHLAIHDCQSHRRIL